MLISEEDADRKTRLPTNAEEQQSQPAAPPAPPSYQASTQPQPLPSSSQAQPILPLHNPTVRHGSYGSIPDSVKIARRQSTRLARKRFCKALFVGLLVWGLLSIFVRTFVGMVKSNGSKPYEDHHHDMPELSPLPSDVHRNRCIKAIDLKPATTDAHNQLTARFGISLHDDYESLVLLSRGYLSRGHTTITQAVESSANTDATVEVTVVYNEYHKDLLRDLTLCSIERGDGGGRRGVGVFSPTQWPRGLPSVDKFPTIIITLHLPANQTFMKTLETDLPNFSQYFSIPPATTGKENLTFGKLAISGTNGAIGGEALHFLEGSISTTNGIIGINNVECNGCVIRTTNEGIHGTYRARHSLSMTTSNAPIDVAVFLGDEEEESVAGFADIHTTNQHLKAEMSLLGKEPSSSGASLYEIRTSTTNSPLDLSILKMPLFSTLQSDSKTTNGRGTVACPNEFEGKFLAQTTNGQVEVQTLHEEDPAGKQRKVHWEFDTMSKGVGKGTKRWGTPAGSHGKGLVALSSTNGPVQLIL